jgi:hypothetical protein
MVYEAAPIDASTMPDVSRLVREVARTGQPRLIQADGDVVRVSPTRRRRHTANEPTQKEFEAAMNATFGSLKGLIDPEQFKRQRRELQVDDREPRSL